VLLASEKKTMRLSMLRKLVILVAILAVIGAAVFWIITMPASVSASALPAYTPNLENGKTMFYAGGCASCHATPKQEDKTRLGGGLGLKSPFGTFFTPNISPDRNDGIGAWSEANFVTAMWKGTSPSGEHYYPAFPYTSYQRMRLDDVRDLFAYLKTLPPVQGKVRDHDLPIYFKFRRMLGGWKFLFLDGQQFKPDPSKSAQWNRGAYLVNGPGHCVECHSPRNVLGAIIAGQRFAGGPDPEGGDGWVPNITQAGIGDYSERDIERVLETGDMPNGDSVGGVMTSVVANTSQLPAADRAAIATYVKSLPPVEGPKHNSGQ
jgi:mono/diheme cytochrome c family protein